MSYAFKVVNLEGYEGWSLVTFKEKLFLVRNGGSVQCGCCLQQEVAPETYYGDEDALEAGKKFIAALKSAEPCQQVRVSGIDGWHQLEWLGEDSKLIHPCAVNGKANQEYEDVTELNAILKSFVSHWSRRHR